MCLTYKQNWNVHKIGKVIQRRKTGLYGHCPTELVPTYMYIGYWTLNLKNKFLISILYIQ